MQTSINANWLSETAFAPDGQSVRPGDGSRWPLPSQRPFSAHPPRRRGFDIRPARTPHQLGVASMLVRRMYSWRGYKTESFGRRWDDQNRVTLAAWQFDEVVATLTLALDSPDGLLADDLYAPELASLRRQNRIVCEVSRLAVDPNFSSRELLTTLFQAALDYAKDTFIASDAVIEVNPRHAHYYQRRLGFQLLGELRQCPRVEAPAVLRHQKLDQIAIPGQAWPDFSRFSADSALAVAVAA